jgi:hypothetical protein
MVKMAVRFAGLFGAAFLIAAGMQTARAAEWASFVDEEYGCRVLYPQNLFHEDVREAGRHLSGFLAPTKRPSSESWEQTMRRPFHLKP